MKHNLTKRFIESLRVPAKGNRIYYDRDSHGLGVRITAAGKISFILSYHVAGVRRRYTLGGGHYFWPDASVTWARDQAETLRTAIQKGGDPLGEKEAEKEAVNAEHTIRDLAERFMEQHARPHKRAGSAHNDGLLLKNHVLPVLGDCRISEVTSQQIEDLKLSMGNRPQGQKSTPYAANRMLSLLSAMFSFDMGKLKKCRCVGWKTRLDNPVIGIPFFDEKKRDTPLNDEQLQALETALENYREQDAADAIRLLILTGARSQEIIRAEWTMFNLKRGTWKKPSTMTKEGEEENVPINDLALLILRRMAATANGGRFLFPGRNGEKPRTSLANCWRAVCKEAGLSTPREIPGKRGKNLVRWKNRYRVHDLRHTYASFLANRGHSLEQIGALLGHKNPQTTHRYAHHADAALRAVTNDFGVMLTTKTQ
jgi:integrase